MLQETYHFLNVVGHIPYILHCIAHNMMSEYISLLIVAYIPYGSKYLLRKCLGYNSQRFGGLSTFLDSGHESLGIVKPITFSAAAASQDDVLSVWNLTNRDNVVRAQKEDCLVPGLSGSLGFWTHWE